MILVPIEYWKAWRLVPGVCAEQKGCQHEVVLMKAVHLQLAQEKPAADEEGVPGLALELVLPGVTVPWAHALYLWIATAVSLGVHEVICLPNFPFLPFC